MAKYIVVHSVRVCTEFVPETFGRLTTIGPAFLLPVGRHAEYKAAQICSCTCGEVMVAGTGSLRSGNTRSCGCLQKEAVVFSRTTHGMRKIPEYNSWSNMKDRCDNRMNPQFADYGGRGITYCERWKKFENFLEDMGRKPGPGFSIERKANNDNYEFSNCVWATRGEQNNNTRRNRRLAHNGTVMTVAQRAEETGIKYTTIQSRLRAGWSVSRILTTSVRKTKRKN